MSNIAYDMEDQGAFFYSDINPYVCPRCNCKLKHTAKNTLHFVERIIAECKSGHKLQIVMQQEGLK